MERSQRMMQRAQIKRSRLGGGDIQNYEQALVRKDLGFKMTDTGYDQYKKDEAKFNNQYNQAQGQLNDANAQLDSYGNQLDAARSSLAEGYSEVDRANIENAWGEYKSTWAPVQVVNGNNVEATYNLPKDVIGKLNSSLFNAGDGSYVGNYVQNGVYNVDVTMAGTGEARGKELHQGIQDAEREIMAKFYETQAPLIAAGKASALSQLNSAQGQLAGKAGELQAQRDLVSARFSELEQAAASRQAQKNRYKKDYKRSVSDRQALFGGGK